VENFFIKYITKAKTTLILSLLCGFLLSSLTVSSEEYPAGIDKIIKRGKLIVAMVKKDHPPFFMAEEDGKLTGNDVHIATAIARELKVKLEINRDAQTFNELIPIVCSGKADMAISKLSKTLIRSKKILYSEPYIVLRKALLMNRLKFAQKKAGRRAIEFIKHLTGKVGVIKGTSYVEFAKRMFPKAEIVTFDSWGEVVNAVSQGEILAAFRDELEIKKVLREMPNASLTLQSVVFKDTKDPIAIAIAHDKPHLCYWLNHFINEKNLKTNVDKLLDNYYKNMKQQKN
jgi:ABC-type amino acid transport substrate-binding protein